MALGRLKSAPEVGYATGPTAAQIAAWRLAEACGREDSITRRAKARIGHKSYVKAMPIFTDQHGGMWRARRIETACPHYGWRESTTSDVAHAFPMMGLGPRDGYETACGMMVYGRSRAGEVRAWITCRACRSSMAKYESGSGEQ